VSSSFDLRPERFAAGATGAPGSRVFYLQATTDGQVVSFRLEKQQVAVLADHLAGVLRDLPSFDWPSGDDLVLVEPVVSEWVVGALAMAYDEVDQAIVVVAEELVEVDEETGEPVQEPSTARFRLTLAQVAGFVRRAAELVLSGRPPCPLCGQPMDPDGHRCPRSNGHRPR
jgi:uncharacterized repeat protein (TIGR03847 family)